MQLRVMTEPQQGATYDDLLRVAREAERLGFDGFFRSDHLARIGAPDDGPWVGSTDAWVTLAGLARDTERIRLGTMLTAATFRLPGPLAVAVATVDAMSGGRVELGIGAAWFDDEHTAYGIPFPPVGERFDRLEEQLRIVTGLWETAPGSTFSFGRFVDYVFTISDPNSGAGNPLQNFQVIGQVTTTGVSVLNFDGNVSFRNFNQVSLPMTAMVEMTLSAPQLDAGSIDFYNTAIASIALPPGFTATSSSGIPLVFAPVPEPSAVALWALGLAAVGFVSRRRGA